VKAELRNLSVKAQTRLLEDSSSALPQGPLPSSSSHSPARAAGEPPSGNLGDSRANLLQAGVAGLLGNVAESVQSNILEPCDVEATVKLTDKVQDVSLDVSDIRLRLSPDVLQLALHLQQVRPRTAD